MTEPGHDPFTIRHATPDDAGRLALAAARFFAQTFGPENRPEDMAAYLADTFTIDRQAADIRDPDSTIWLAEVRQSSAPPASAAELIGYVQLRQRAGASAVTAQQPAEIARLYVDKAWLGRGVGAALVETCLNAAQASGADVAWLGVWERNARAIRFYEKYGFRRVGTQQFQLGSDLQTDLVMARPLGGD